jgi:EmrB/QacA subfamily drug resistance transporter
MTYLSQLRKRDASPALVLAIVCAGVVLASLDLFIVNLALPSIGRDLHQPNLTDLSWILNAYAIVYASLLVLLGRLSERYNREAGFLVGTALFTISSAACGAAPNLSVLVAFRIVQAVGAALLTPTSLSLILATAAPERRASSVRAWTAVGGVAAGLGPVLGGLLIAASWRWVFFVNVPVGILAILVGWRRLPTVAGRPVPRPDALGALLITAGVGALTLGLVEGNNWGWGSGRVLGALAASIVLLAGFVLHTMRSSNPLLERSLFRVRAFNGSAVVALLFSTAFGAMLLSVVLWMQTVWNWSPLHAGLAFAPGPLLVPVFAFLVAARAIPRFGPGRVIGVGATLYAAGAAYWALRSGVHPNYLGAILPGTILTGAGVGLTLPTFMAAGTQALPPTSFATGSAAVNMLRQVGLAIGVAILIALLGTPHSDAALVSGFHHGWYVIAAFSFAAALAGLVLLRNRPAEVAQNAAAPGAGAVQASRTPGVLAGTLAE